jgi:hypothetical protein
MDERLRPFNHSPLAAVKAAASAPLIFRQSAHRRILHTDIELVLELPAGHAEVLFSYGSAHAVGRHVTFNERSLPDVHARARPSAAHADSSELFDGR